MKWKWRFDNIILTSCVWRSSNLINNDIKIHNYKKKLIFCIILFTIELNDYTAMQSTIFFIAFICVVFFFLSFLYQRWKLRLTWNCFIGTNNTSLFVGDVSSKGLRGSGDGRIKLPKMFAVKIVYTQNFRGGGCAHANRWTDV